MPKFSTTSIERLKTCHPWLQDICNEIIKHFDCTIVYGHRNKVQQTIAFQENKSKVEWPNSKHNKTPSLAVDVAPYLNGKISWNTYHCLYLAGMIMGIASQLKIPLRYGGDWDMDDEVITDQTFQDLVHFEIIKE